jgi:hypothetical protein
MQSLPCCRCRCGSGQRATFHTDAITPPYHNPHYRRGDEERDKTGDAADQPNAGGPKGVKHDGNPPRGKTVTPLGRGALPTTPSRFATRSARAARTDAGSVHRSLTPADDYWGAGAERHHGTQPTPPQETPVILPLAGVSFLAHPAASRARLSAMPAATQAEQSKSLARNRKPCTGVAATKAIACSRTGFGVKPTRAGPRARPL